MRICIVETYPYESITNGDTIYISNLCEYLCKKGHEIYFVVTNTSRGRTRPFYKSRYDVRKFKKYIARRTIKCGSFFIGVGRDHFVNLFARIFKVKRNANDYGTSEIAWLKKIVVEIEPELTFFMFGAHFLARHFDGLNMVVCPSFIPHRERCLPSIDHHGLDYDEKNATEFVNELRDYKTVCFNNFDDVKFATDNGLHNAFFVGMGFKNQLNQQSDCSENNLIFAASNNTTTLKSVSWFLDHVWPFILKQFSDARLFLVGAICNSFLNSDIPSVELKGYVSSKELGEIYLRSKIAIAPLVLGTRGIKTKVVEAISFGCPVVTTSIGIDFGKPDQFNGAVLIGDTPEEFLKHVLKLLSDESFLIRAREQCRIVLANSLSFEASYAQLSQKFSL